MFTNTSGPKLSSLRETWAIRTVYQPLVDLRNSAVIGVEALTRSGELAPVSSIVEMFDSARTVGRAEELDWLCRCTAIDSWLAQTRDRSLALFLNVEAATLSATEPLWVTLCEDVLQSSGTPVVMELTERSLDKSPHDLLRFRDTVRERGWMLAIDDIGVTPASLALIPLLEPDILKLDMLLLHNAPTAETAQVVNAVRAHAARTGAKIVAEGIETAEHLQLAISAGADFGQGWLFGKPVAAMPHAAKQRQPANLRAEPIPAPPIPAAATTPWELIADRDDVRRSRKPLLAAISTHIELQVDQSGGAAVVLGTFQHARNLTGPIAARYARFGAHVSFAGVLGVGMPPNPAPGVRGCALEPSDPLSLEWTVVVISPFFSAALIARDTGEPAETDADREFDYLVTYDRELVTRASQILIQQFR